LLLGFRYAGSHGVANRWLQCYSRRLKYQMYPCLTIILLYIASLFVKNALIMQHTL